MPQRPKPKSSGTVRSFRVDYMNAIQDLIDIRDSEIDHQYYRDWVIFSRKSPELLYGRFS